MLEGSAGKGVLGCGALILVAIVGVFLFWISGAIVPAGYVGVRSTFGQVEPVALGPGFHFTVPLMQHIAQIDVKVQPHTFADIDAASSEYQQVKLTGTMNYHLDPNRAVELYQTVGLDFASKVIDPAFSDFIKEVVPRYAIKEILGKRDEIRSQARQRLGENLNRYGIVVDDIYISNISFSPEYATAIESAAVAQKNVEKESQLLEQKKIQAQQNVVDAQGQGDAKVALAQREAEANRQIATSITPELTDYLRVTLWDGHLPEVVGGAVSPFVAVGQEDAPATSSTAAPGHP